VLRRRRRQRHVARTPDVNTASDNIAEGASAAGAPTASEADDTLTAALTASASAALAGAAKDVNGQPGRVVRSHSSLSNSDLRHGPVSLDERGGGGPTLLSRVSVDCTGGHSARSRDCKLDRCGSDETLRKNSAVFTNRIGGTESDEHGDVTSDADSPLLMPPSLSTRTSMGVMMPFSTALNSTASSTSLHAPHSSDRALETTASTTHAASSESGPALSTTSPLLASSLLMQFNRNRNLGVLSPRTTFDAPLSDEGHSPASSSASSLAVTSTLHAPAIWRSLKNPMHKGVSSPFRRRRKADAYAGSSDDPSAAATSAAATATTATATATATATTTATATATARARATATATARARARATAGRKRKRETEVDTKAARARSAESPAVIWTGCFRQQFLAWLSKSKTMWAAQRTARRARRDASQGHKGSLLLGGGAGQHASAAGAGLGAGVGFDPMEGWGDLNEFMDEFTDGLDGWTSGQDDVTGATSQHHFPRAHIENHTGAHTDMRTCVCVCVFSCARTRTTFLPHTHTHTRARARAQEHAIPSTRACTTPYAFTHVLPLAHACTPFHSTDSCTRCSAITTDGHIAR
jgi:hypothetical protein